MISTTDEEPLLPFSMCHPLLLMGSNEEVVSGPAPGTPTNENPNAIANFGLCRYCGIFANSPVHNATKDDCITIPVHKWGSVLNDSVPAGGRHEDSSSRSACYRRLKLPLRGEEGMEPPALDAISKEVQWGLQKVEEFEDVVVVRAGYIRATNDMRQHWHPLTHKTQGKALSVFVPCNVDL